jgi:hypothetical protein
MLIGAGAGAGAGIYGAFQQNASQKRQIEQQKKTAWQQYLLGKSFSDAQYSIQQGEAAYQLGVQERRLGQAMDQNTEQYNTGLLGQALGIQNTQIETASGVGASLAAEAAGGTRGNAANGLARDYAEANLDRQIDIQYRQNRGQLESIITGANNALQDIGREWDSWSDGGYRYEMKQAQDEYNKNIAVLGQNNFDWQTKELQANFAWNATASAFSGAKAGWDFMGGILDAKKNFF